MNKIILALLLTLSAVSADEINIAVPGGFELGKPVPANVKEECVRTSRGSKTAVYECPTTIKTPTQLHRRTKWIAFSTYRDTVYGVEVQMDIDTTIYAARTFYLAWAVRYHLGEHENKSKHPLVCDKDPLVCKVEDVRWDTFNNKHFILGLFWEGENTEQNGKGNVGIIVTDNDLSDKAYESQQEDAVDEQQREYDRALE